MRPSNPYLIRGLATCLLSMTVFACCGVRAEPFVEQRVALEVRLDRIEEDAGGLRPALGSRDYRAALTLYELIDTVGVGHLEELRAEPNGEAFLEAFLGDDDWMRMFLLSGPLGKAPEAALRKLHFLWREDRACAETLADKTLATAVALDYGSCGWTDAQAWTRYTFYRDSARDELLHPVYDTLGAWEKRWLTGHRLSMHGEATSQQWLRDNVKLPVSGYRKACWQVPYRGHNCFGDSVQSWVYYFPFQGSFGSFTEMTRFVGGVCGRLSGYGAGAAVANGIPATTMGEPGHCAYAVRLGRGNWAPAYSLSWKRGIHVSLYGKTWQMLLLTEEMLGSEAAWEASNMHLWQARRHRPRVELSEATGGDHPQVEMTHAGVAPQAREAYELAVKAQPANYVAWDRYGAWLRSAGADEQAWRAYHDGVLAGLAAFPEAAWTLISKRVYPSILPAMSPAERVSLLAAFHEKLDGWGTGRWNVEGALGHQLKQVGKEQTPRFRFAETVVSAHRNSSAYLGPALAWAYGQLAKTAETQERFFDLVSGVLASDEGEVHSKAVLDMCSKAVVAAEKDGDADTFRAVGQLAERVLEKPGEFVPAFEGELLSEGGFTQFSSISGRWDKTPYLHCMIPGKRRGWFHSNEEENPWVRIEMRHFGELTGIEIVNRPGQLARAVPLHVLVSEDGEEWEEIAVLRKAKGAWQVDLRGKGIRARHVKAFKEGRGILHLLNIRVYGRRLS